MTSTISGTDPRTWATLPSVAEATSTAEVDVIARAAATAFAELRQCDRSFRAALLRSIADRVEQHREDLVRIATTETGFSESKLEGELTRTAFQFRLFADVVDEGSFLEVTID